MRSLTVAFKPAIAFPTTIKQMPKKNVPFICIFRHFLVRIEDAYFSNKKTTLGPLIDNSFLDYFHIEWS